MKTSLRSLLFLFGFCILRLTAQEVQIQEIQVRNLTREGQDGISSVRAFIQPRVGDAYDRRLVNEDIRSLQETGRYAYVGVELLPLENNRVILIYVVEERARLRNIRITGGDAISNAAIRKELELELGDRVDIALVEQKLLPIRDKYRKKFYTEVQFDTTLSPADEDGFTDLALTVNEGPKQKVKDIEFTGNIAYTDREVRAVMMQKQVWLLSVFSGRGGLNEEALRLDRYRIQELYRKLGYLDASVGEPQLKRTPKGLVVVLPIEANQQYRVRSIRIEGNTLYPSSLLGARVPLQVGGIAGSDDIERGRRAIRDFYNVRGYSKTLVRQRILLTNQPDQVDIVYTIREGEVATVRNVLIRGNTRTKDYVIRREVNVVPGETLNEVSVRNSAARIRNLGFMEMANHAVLPTRDPTVYDVEFEVREARSGNFLAGVGFSSEDSLVGFVELSQGNFDLTDPPGFIGGGEKLQTRLQLGTERQDVEVNYSRPWFLNRRLTFSVRGFINEREFLSDDYNQRNTGASVGLRKHLFGRWRGDLSYQLEEIEVFDVAEDASEVIKQEEGSSLRSSLNYSMTHDTRNQVWIPTRGGRTILSAGLIGGPLGFDEDIYELGARASYYFPLIWNRDHNLNLHGWARTVDFYGDSDRVPIFDRLFLGGARTIRAFDFRDVSPVDENGDPIGGQTMLFASAEYTIPLTELFRVAGFYDWGVVNLDPYDASTDEMNSSYGIGLRIDMPGFPLRFDYSWQHFASEWNESNGGKFSFLIGYSF